MAEPFESHSGAEAVEVRSGAEPFASRSEYEVLNSFLLVQPPFAAKTVLFVDCAGEGLWFL